MDGIETKQQIDTDNIINSLDVSENTRYEYKQRIKPFLRFVQSQGFSLNVLLEYKRSLRAQNYSVATKNKYLACARVFLKECYRLGIMDRDVTSNVKGFRQDKKHKVNGLTNAEVLLICEWIRNHPDKRREQAILCLLLFQGLRQAEICRIRLQDIDFESEKLSILGKGRDDKERVYLHPKTVTALKRYCEDADIQADEYLFTSKTRTSDSLRLTERGLQHIVKSILNDLGINKTVHGFRHHYATKLIREMPSNLTVIAQFTRHRSLEMLQIYNDSVLLEKDFVHYRDVFNNLPV